MKEIKCANCSEKIFRSRNRKDAICNDCKKKYQADYYRKNSEHWISKSKENRIKNKEEIKKKRAERYLKNREKIISDRKKYYLKNKDKIIERNKAWRKSNSVVRERIRTRNRLRKDKIRSLGNISGKWLASLRDQSKNCPICIAEMTDYVGEFQKQLDHIIPIAAGGLHTKENVRYVCRTCNLSRPKDGRDLENYRNTNI